jgi:hypothetical protein
VVFYMFSIGSSLCTVGNAMRVVGVLPRLYGCAVVCNPQHTSAVDVNWNIHIVRPAYATKSPCNQERQPKLRTEIGIGWTLHVIFYDLTS